MSKCKRHPDYDGRRQPWRSECYECWQFFDDQQRMRERDKKQQEINTKLFRGGEGMKF